MREAVTHFLENKAQKNVSKNWLQKYKRELPHFAAWCESKARYVKLASLDLLGLEDYRKTWTGAAATRRKRQERPCSFLGYGLRHKWIERNVAADLRVPLAEAGYRPLARPPAAIGNLRDSIRADLDQLTS